MKKDLNSVFPLDAATLKRHAEACHLPEPGQVSIREMNRLINTIELAHDVRYVRMEFGIPGLPTHAAAIEAEVDVLRGGKLTHVYAPFEGVPALKQEASRFARLFMDVDVPPDCCVPTVGAMQGCFAALTLAGQLDRERQTVLFLEPGFPVNKLQTRLLGLKHDSIDFFDHRGDDLIRAIDERAERGDLCALIWSSPNNPTWIMLDDDELRGIGQACDRHDLLAIEDMAYFGMDLRRDYTRPGEPPYQPTVLNHTDRAVTIISSSKMFSYAGQRIALSLISPALMNDCRPALSARLGTERVGHALLHGILYPMTACVPESPQYGLLALLREANNGNGEVFEPAREYGRRAAAVKRAFLTHGFRLVYDNDRGEPLADGFYFTVAHPGFDDGGALVKELLRYGISAITLGSTGSCRGEGLRACVSMIDDAQLKILDQRLSLFAGDHELTGRKR